MKNFLQRIKEFCRKDNVAFCLSLIGPLAMGTIHLVFTILKFDWIFINYCVFSYLMVLAKVWQWAIEKNGAKPSHYSAGIISMFLALAPMMAAIVLTIMNKDESHFFQGWLVYAYAAYGTLKMVFAIKGMAKKNKTDREYVLSFLGLVVALYTVKMMETNLIANFSGGSDASMYMLQLFTQGALFLFSLFVIGLFAHKAIALRKSNDLSKE
ncbi:MAG: hypothetical protein E7179_04345 [Erysipelotrichaceae bacterium]|jgi:hypothetical protein|nr:hypothetical protein [Erysipelotrichaceae bacterium]